MSRFTLPALFLVLLFILWPALANSQNGDILIEKYSLEEGLSNSTVLDICEDKYGFLWFATEHGLNRFDGKEFKIFRYNPDDPETIRANYVNRIYEDPKGNIWVLYGVGGMSQFNRATSKFIYYTYNRTQSNHPNNYVRSLFWDEDDMMWICTSGGLNHLDPANKAFRKVELAGIDDPEDNFPVNFAMTDLSGRIWVFASQGMFELDKSALKLSPALKSGETMNEPVSASVWRINNEAKGEFFIGTIGEGVFKYNESSGLFDPIAIENVSQAGKEFITSSLFRDRSGKLWACFRDEGLFYFDGLEMVFKPLNAVHPLDMIFAFSDSTGGLWSISENFHFFYQNYEGGETRMINPFSENEVPPRLNAVLIDRKGNIWTGTHAKGILKFQTETPYFKHFKDFRVENDQALLNPFVTALSHGSGQMLWIGTQGSLHAYNKKEKRFVAIQKTFPALSEHSDRWISCLFNDSQNRLFVSDFSGLSVFDKNYKQIFQFTDNSSTNQNSRLLSNAISSIAESKNGRYWIASNKGLNLLDLNKGTIKAFRHEPGNENTLNANSVSCLLEDSNGSLWAGTIGGGLNQLAGWENDEPVFKKYFLASKHEDKYHKLMTVNALFEDGNKVLWVGTYSRGLLRYDADTDKLITIPTADGLPIPNITGILQDDMGFLWISSNDGLARYDPVNNSFRHFNEDDGIQSLEFNARAYSKGEDGCLYFGGINGFNEFHPGAIGEKQAPQKPLITGFNLFGEPNYFDDPVMEMEELVLGHKQNFFSFNFISLDFKNPEKLQYAYFLENLDQGWDRAGSNGIASYANVPPGKYIFRVKATNYENKSSQTANLRVIITPPFWQESWFLILVCVLITALLYGVHVFRVRLRLSKIREIERIREKAAADFHDELGHRLTKISLFTEMIFRTTKPGGDLARYLEKIRENSNGLYHSMRDFIWAMNPKKDSIFELGILLKDFGDELFDKTKVNFRVHGIEEVQKEIKLNMDWKRHLVLMFKEAMHNTLKHASCKNATLQISLAEKRLTIELKDDGKGFVRKEENNGYGIGNMYTRAKKLNGELEIQSYIEKGTIIKFTGII